MTGTANDQEYPLISDSTRVTGSPGGAAARCPMGAVTASGMGPQPGQTHPSEAATAAAAVGRHSSPEPRPGPQPGPDDHRPEHGPEEHPEQAKDHREHGPDLDGETIEATTGVPLAMLPQRAPRIAAPFVASAAPGGSSSGRAGTGSAPGSDPAGPLADEEDFWLPIEEVHWDGTPITPTPRRWFGWFRRSPADATRRRTPRPAKPPRHPAAGLAGSIAFALAASFFAWVSAQPMWLAFGHGDQGVATVTGCTGSGLGQQCRGEFTPGDNSYAAWDLRLAGVPAGAREPGSRVPARMVGPDSDIAYAGSGTSPLHLRWSIGLALVLLCGAGIGWASGALRLPDRWSRRTAALVSVAGPLLIAAGFLLTAR